MITYYNEAHRKRAMKSFTAFVAEFPRILKDGKFVCMECDGYGRVVPNDAFNDPVEGYKMAERVTCPSCGGLKYTFEKTYRDYFKKTQAEYRKQEKERIRIKKIRSQALKKLTKEEREALDIYDY